jgi:hypothetical protein
MCRNLTVSRRMKIASPGGGNFMGSQFVEPTVVPDVYISGVIGPEDIGDGNLRFTGYAKQEIFDRDGAVQFVIVNRLIIPRPVVIQSIKDTMRILGIASVDRLKSAH